MSRVESLFREFFCCRISAHDILYLKIEILIQLNQDARKNDANVNHGTAALSGRVSLENSDYEYEVRVPQGGTVDEQATHGWGGERGDDWTKEGMAK